LGSQSLRSHPKNPCALNSGRFWIQYERIPNRWFHSKMDAGALALALDIVAAMREHNQKVQLDRFTLISPGVQSL